MDFAPEERINIDNVISYRPSEEKSVKKQYAKYHYTSPEGMLAIVKNKSVYFTDIRYFNDKSENIYIYKCFFDFLNNHPGEYNILESVLNKIVNTPKEKIMSLDVSQVDVDFPFKIPNRRCFVLCTCKDSDSLCMWNYYVKNGTYQGYNIGLSPANFLKSIKDASKDFEILYGDVIYKTDTQQEEIKKVAEALETHFSKEDDFMRAAVALYLYIQRYSSFFKSDKFSHEKEYRFVISIDDDKLMNAVKESTNISYDYRTSNGLIIPYINVRFSDDTVKKITISPIIEKEITIKSIIELCENHSYKSVIVESSNIPIRY